MTSSTRAATLVMGVGGPSAVWTATIVARPPQVTVRHSWNSATKAGEVRELPLLAPAAEALRLQRKHGKPVRHVTSSTTGFAVRE